MSEEVKKNCSEVILSFFHAVGGMFGVVRGCSKVFVSFILW